LLEELNKDGTFLNPTLRGPNAIVICTGTTAFPTNAWSRSGEFSITNQVPKALVDNKFSVQDPIWTNWASTRPAMSMLVRMN
jgi:hypothetical protein